MNLSQDWRKTINPYDEECLQTLRKLYTLVDTMTMNDVTWLLAPFNDDKEPNEPKIDAWTRTTPAIEQVIKIVERNIAHAEKGIH